MELCEWLETRAGLTGNKLKVALQQCEGNMCETLGDLQRAQENGMLDKILTSGMLQIDVKAALNDEKQRPTKAPAVVVSQDKHKMVASRTKPSQLDGRLPSHKEFGAFISHKKVVLYQ